MSVGGNNIELIGSGTPAGCTMGADRTELAGFHGLACAQATVIAATDTTSATSTTPWGFASSTQANMIISNQNAILTALKNKGIIASA